MAPMENVDGAKPLAIDIESSEPVKDEKHGEHLIYIDEALQKSYRWKLDLYLLPFLSLMYLFNSVDRVSRHSGSKLHRAFC